jgi:hypothetical protein
MIVQRQRPCTVLNLASILPSWLLEKNLVIHLALSGPELSGRGVWPPTLLSSSPSLLVASTLPLSFYGLFS